MTSRRRLLVVDGYNVAHAWPATRALLDRRAPLEDVRRGLLVRLAAHAAITGDHVVAVFDGPRRRGSGGPPEVVDGVEVHFAGAAEASADHLIERLVYSATRGEHGRVTVATSDRLIRDVVRAMGAETIDASGLAGEVEAGGAELTARIAALAGGAVGVRRLDRQLSAEVRAYLEELRREAPPGTAQPAPAAAHPRTRTRERYRPFDPERDSL